MSDPKQSASSYSEAYERLVDGMDHSDPEACREAAEEFMSDAAECDVGDL